jgi:hypothetical protein
MGTQVLRNSCFDASGSWLLPLKVIPRLLAPAWLLTSTPFRAATHVASAVTSTAGQSTKRSAELAVASSATAMALSHEIHLLRGFVGACGGWAPAETGEVSAGSLACNRIIMRPQKTISCRPGREDFSSRPGFLASQPSPGGCNGATWIRSVTIWPQTDVAPL